MSSPFDELKYKELLEGLEISEVKYSEIEKENRYDSDFFMKRFLKNEFVLLNRKHFFVNDEFIVTDGEHGSVEYLESGVKYLTAENIKQGFVDISNVRYVSNAVDLKNKRASVETGDILISIKGTLGQIAIAESWLKPCNMNRDVAIIKSKNNKKKNEYLAVFLMSKFGEIQSSRGGSGGVQQMITLERLRNFIVPEMQDSFYEAIGKTYKESLSKLSVSKRLYAEAEDILLSELGLKGWQSNNNPVNIKPLKESFLASGRLDAEYYQTKYDEIESVITKYKYGYDRIENLFSQNTEVCNYKEEAYNYIEIGDINIGDGSANYNLVSTENLPDNAKRVLHKNDILVSKVRPYRGAVSIVDFDDEKLIGSGAFTVLHEKTSYKKEVLQILLRTQIYKDWLLKWNVGSSYPVIKDEDIMNLPIPLFPNTVQTEIAEYVQKSMSLRGEAKKLLDQAKRMVEKEIEEGNID